MDTEQAKAILMQRMGWSEEEFAQNEAWARDNCICGGCPSYTASETEFAFCWPAIGKSMHISEERNCVCGQCPVFNQAKLKFAYYCTRDSEMAQTHEAAEQQVA